MSDAVIYLVVWGIALVGFCFVAWWVHRSSQWRVGYPATWVSTLRLVILNAVLLEFVLEFSPPLPSFYFLGNLFTPFMTLVVAPVTVGSVTLALLQHASLRHSFMGMALSYISIVVVIGRNIMENYLTIYMNQEMAWKIVDSAFLFFPLYFLLFTTGGYVLSEWLEYKRD